MRRSGMLFPARAHRDRIVGANAHAHLDQLFGNLQAGRVAQIVRIGLEREPQQSNRAAFQDIQLLL